MKDELNKAWRQLSGESARHYQLFDFYLMLNPIERSYQRVSEHFSLSREYVERISKKFHWTERARAHTNYFIDAADRAKEKAAREIAFDWADWEIANLDRVRIITETLLLRCEQMLEAPLTEQTEKTNPVIDPETGAKLTDSEGNIVYRKITITKPVRFAASDVPKYAEASVILTKYLAEQNRAGGLPLSAFLPAPSKPVEEMSIQERSDFIDLLRERQRQISTGENIIELDTDEEQ